MEIGKKYVVTRVILYLVVVILVFSVFSVVCSTSIVEVGPGGDGFIDLRTMNLNDIVVAVSTSAALVYENKFYMPEAFAAGEVTGGARLNDTNSLLGDYGTVRIVLRLPAGHVYAVSSKSAAYAQRLFINGEEHLSVGAVGRTVEEVVPKNTRYTEAFLPETDTTEIIIHYSNLVHPDPGTFHALRIGLTGNVERVEQMTTFKVVIITGALLAAMLFFFGLFIFYSSNKYLLWFSLACGCIAMRGLLTGDKVLMLAAPWLNWYTTIRMEYLSTCGMVLFSALYLNSLFDRVISKRIINSFIIFCCAAAVFFCVAPPMIFTRAVWYILGITVVFFLYALVIVYRAVIMKKASKLLTGTEQVLLVSGLTIFFILSALEIYAHENALFILGLDLAQVGMIACLFTSILAISLSFAHLERSLDETRRSERESLETNRMLKRLDKLRIDFLANITHEMKTPLTVIKGYALLAVQDIDDGCVDDATREHLVIISGEAQRLADLAAGLLKSSAGTGRADKRREISEIFENAANMLHPIIAKNSNRLEYRAAGGLPPVLADGDVVHQVLINLAANANRHTSGGVITFAAERGDNGFVAFSVSDNGNGIPSELLPRVFERHISGDGGDGLGLAICKENIELHGGKIAIESTQGGGTTVRFTLPCAEEWDI